MDKKKLEKFVERLNAEKVRLLDHNQKLADEEIQLNHDDLADEVDLASSELNQNMVLRLKDRERHLLQKIEEALERIQEGTFGICEECEEPIETKRLEARPVATLCIQCKEAEEKKEKIYA